MDIRILAQPLYFLYYHDIDNLDEVSLCAQIAEKFRNNSTQEHRAEIFETLRACLEVKNHDYLGILPFKERFSNDDLQFFLKKFHYFMIVQKLDE